MFSYFTGKKQQEKKSDFEIEEDDDGEDSEFTRTLQVNLSRLIAYAESADTVLQREVAEKLANEAVNPKRQSQIVDYGGLQLLVPLAKSPDIEVQRLAAHALANLSVNPTNQELMAREGGIRMLIPLLKSEHELVQRQSAKALANLAVNANNKTVIAAEGGISALVVLAASPHTSVRIEAIAALANLAVNDANEVLIAEAGGIVPIISGLKFAVESISYNSSCCKPDQLMNLEELIAQCARAIRNLSVKDSNKHEIINLGGYPLLESIALYNNNRITQQAKKALKNLGGYDNGSRK